MRTKIYLHSVGFILVVYGLFCFVNPKLLVSLAGVSSLNAEGTAELRTMYGGVQIAVGLFYSYAALSPSLIRMALCFNLFLFGGITAARTLAIALATLTLGADDKNLIFNPQALLFFEIPVLIIGAVLFFHNNHKIDTTSK